MKVFFDTEFTGLHKKTTLISIGLVSDIGDCFYAEATDYDKDQCIDNEFINTKVLPNLFGDIEIPATNTYVQKLQCELGVSVNSYHGFKYVNGNTDVIRTELLKWLGLYESVEWCSDVCHYDFVLLIDLLFGDALSIPPNMDRVCYDINYDVAKFYNVTLDKAFDYSRTKIVHNSLVYSYIPKGLKEHNALYDAFIIRAAYNAVHLHK
jgi:DNA polymerase III epsilon subunit-like protein